MGRQIVACKSCFMVLCSTKQRVMVKPRPIIQYPDLGLSETWHLGPYMYYPIPDTQDLNTCFNQNSKLFLSFQSFYCSLTKRKGKQIRKMRIRREKLSQRLCYYSIHICHLTCNFGYFLLENIQSEYTNLFKFRVLGFSTLFLKTFRSSQKTI